MNWAQGLVLAGLLQIVVFFIASISADTGKQWVSRYIGLNLVGLFLFGAWAAFKWTILNWQYLGTL